MYEYKFFFSFFSQTKCHYIDGGCLSSPRWVSLLVAEVYYPDTYLPSVPNNRRLPVTPQQQQGGVYRTQTQGDDPPSVQDFQNYQQYLHKRATQGPADPLLSQSSTSTSKKKHHCDGIDELGCFQASIFQYIVRIRTFLSMHNAFYVFLLNQN